MSDELCLGSDLTINRTGFGAMRLPTATTLGPPRDPKTGIAVLRRALELGVNHIDTADFYRSGDGSVRANELIRRALHPYPPGLVIATKVGPIFAPEGPRQGSAKDIRPQVEGNLQALGVDCLDVVYLRIGMMEVPHGESLADRFKVLAAMREEGLIRHLGLSNIDTAHLAEACDIAPVVLVQNNFHITNRGERTVLEKCAELGIGFAPFYPLGGGRTDINDAALAKIAKQRGATVSQIALAWLLALSPVTVAIPGTGSLAHLEENIAARSFTLTPEELRELS